MGRKRNIQGYKNHICYAGCMIFILLFVGCQYSYYPKVSLETEEEQLGKEFLLKAMKHVVKGDFKTALVENKKAFDFFPQKLKMEAIIQKALIYAHPDNPGRDYKKAILCFDLIDKDTNNAIPTYYSALILSYLRESCSLAEKEELTLKSIEADKKKIETLTKEQKKIKKYIVKLRQQIKQLKEVDLNFSMGIQGVIYE